MLPEVLHVMLLLDGTLPTVLPVVGEWRPSLLRATAALCHYPASACEAMVVVSQCSEILLKTALAVTSMLALYLSAMLRLNAFLRLTLAGALFSREEPGQRGRPGRAARPSSRTRGHTSCAALRRGGGRSANWLNSVRSVLRVVPALCLRSLSVCVNILTLVQVALSALSALCRSFRFTVSTIVTLSGPVLFALQTVTGHSTQACGTVWDLSPL